MCEVPAVLFVWWKTLLCWFCAPPPADHFSKFLPFLEEADAKLLKRNLLQIPYWSRGTIGCQKHQYSPSVLNFSCFSENVHKSDFNICFSGVSKSNQQAAPKYSKTMDPSEAFLGGVLNNLKSVCVLWC